MQSYHMIQGNMKERLVSQTIHPGSYVSTHCYLWERDKLNWGWGGYWKNPRTQMKVSLKI